MTLSLPRSPVYDIRELTGVDDDTSSMVGSLEREKGVLVDDLRWQGQSPRELIHTPLPHLPLYTFSLHTFPSTPSPSTPFPSQTPLVAATTRVVFICLARAELAKSSSHSTVIAHSGVCSSGVCVCMCGYMPYIHLCNSPFESTCTVHVMFFFVCVGLVFAVLGYYFGGWVAFLPPCYMHVIHVYFVCMVYIVHVYTRTLYGTLYVY